MLERMALFSVGIQYYGTRSAFLSLIPQIVLPPYFVGANAPCLCLTASLSQYDGSVVSSVDINAHGFFAVIMVSFKCPAAHEFIEHLRHAGKSKT